MTSDDENPTINLAGQSYQVKPLAFRDVSKILPVVGNAFSSPRMSEDQLTALAQIVFYGLRKAHPDLTLDAVLDMPVSVEEMTAAAVTICQRAGLKKKESDSGEAKAASTPPTLMN
jgi:hypothetical protein